jgi:hypothetical protein
MFCVVFIYDQIKSFFYSNKESFDNQIDNDAIQKLTKFATDLTTGGLTVPSNLTVSNKLATNGLDPNNMPPGSSGGIRFFDGYCSGTLYFGDNGIEQRVWINKYGNAAFSGNIDIGSNINVNNDVNINGGWLRVKGDNGIYFQDRGGGWYMNDTNWIRSYGGKNVYCDSGIRSRDMSTEQQMQVGTDLNVGGKLKVGNSIQIGNTVINEDHLKMLANGFKLQSIENGHYNGWYIHTHGDGHMARADHQYRTTYKMHVS